jgi:hypothetical protein
MLIVVEHPDTAVKRRSARTNNDARTKDTYGQSALPVKRQENVVRIGLRPGIICARGWLWVRRRIVGNDRLGIADVKAGDRTDMNKPLGTGLKTAFRDRTRASDKSLLNGGPVLAAAAMREVNNDWNTIYSARHIGPARDVARDNRNVRA